MQNYDQKGNLDKSQEPDLSQAVIVLAEKKPTNFHDVIHLYPIGQQSYLEIESNLPFQGGSGSTTSTTPF